MDGHHWLTMHWMRFDQAKSPDEVDYRPSSLADCWRFGLDSPLGEDGLREMRAEVWGGIGIFERESDAQAVFSTPADHLPFVGPSLEAWHALAVPVSHHGTVNWRGAVENGTALRVVPRDPGGPLGVLTTAAYNTYSADEIPRIVDFLAHGDRILKSFINHPGNVRSCLFMPFDLFDGLTCTLWKNDAAMLDAVYRAGPHREQMIRHASTPVFDRSCFTRVRIVRSKGSWDGKNPVEEMEHAGSD